MSMFLEVLGLVAGSGRHEDISPEEAAEYYVVTDEEIAAMMEAEDQRQTNEAFTKPAVEVPASPGKFSKAQRLLAIALLRALPLFAH